MTSPPVTPSAPADPLTAHSPIVIPAAVHGRLLATIASRLPRKSFGYLLSTGDPRSVDDFVLFEDNTRNSADWRGKFEAYGQYFIDHDDAGFVCTPEESWRIQKHIWSLGMVEVGVFHSHLRHPANFSLIDYDMHIQRYSHLWHLIASVRNPELPQVRVFDVAEDAVREQPIVAVELALEHPAHSNSREHAVTKARRILRLDASGRPACPDNRAIVEAIDALLATHDREVIDDLLVRGFLGGSIERFQQHIAPSLQAIPAAHFEMGTTLAAKRHFVGECPAHQVALAPYSISSLAVTNQLYALFDPRHASLAPGKPAVDVSWYDASVFALWMGCRLPSEAEWEFACGAGSAAEWACSEESLLPQMAWYSENSAGEVREAGILQPNAFGLFDMHGNVWEWTHDRHHQDAYSGAQPPDSAHRVCRGGSIHALSEMCRTRYRFHDPASFSASDLGFRLAASNTPNGE